MPYRRLFLLAALVFALASPMSAATHNVTVGPDTAFHPAQLTIQAGDVWLNNAAGASLATTSVVIGNGSNDSTLTAVNNNQLRRNRRELPTTHRHASVRTGRTQVRRETLRRSDWPRRRRCRHREAGVARCAAGFSVRLRWAVIE